jgi:eukaryotic-like serine/threonine-protein kinase
LPGERAELVAPGQASAKAGRSSAAFEATSLRSVGIGSELGRYRLEAPLGRGGMAEVFRARDRELRRDVAVKVLMPHLARDRQVVARFHREARAAASLDHPNILRVYDVGGGEAPVAGEGAGAVDPPFIVLELVPDGTLAELASARAPLPAELVACMGVVIAGALAEVHRAGILHRDVKPANILLGAGGRLLLSDFGVARVEGGDSLVTRDGAVLGTPSYMSPEQAFGEPQGPRSDLYALGATLYHLATGSPPVGGPTTRALAAIAAGDIPDPLRRNRGMGPDLAAVVRKLMARNPDERFADADEAARALRRAAGHLAGDEPAAAVSAYLDDPEGQGETLCEAAVREALREASAVARRDPPRALALADRVFALDPENGEATALLARVSAGKRRARIAAFSAAAMIVAGVAWGASEIGPGSEETGGEETRDGLAISSFRAPAPATATEASAREAEDESARELGPDPELNSEPAPEGAPSAEARPLASAVAEGRRAAPPDGALRRPREPASAAPSATPPPADSPVAAPPDAGVVEVTPPEPPAPAQLTLVADAWCDLQADGKPLGRAHRRLTVELSPGRYELTCGQGPGLGSWSGRVELLPGQTREIHAELLAPVTISVSLSGGDRARVGDLEATNGARLRLRPDRYRVEVLAGGRVVEAGWVSIPRTQACELRDHPSLGCFRADSRRDL